jgi:hypothetical protein
MVMRTRCEHQLVLSEEERLQLVQLLNDFPETEDHPLWKFSLDMLDAVNPS